jgi:putative oxidoreductase
MKVPFTIGRLLFGGFFLYNGINHFLQYKTLAQYAEFKKVPLPVVAVLATGTLLTAGGASLLLGVKPKLGAAAVIAFLGGVSPVMHDFWNDESPEMRQMNQAHFMKNAALLGGALALAAVEEPWPLSIPVGQPGTGSESNRIAA